jgi:hypothetical protein
MWDSRRETRIFVRVLLASFILIAVLTILYLLFGERIITDLSTGQRASFLGFQLHSAERSLPDILREANSRFLTFIVIGIPATIVVFFLFFKLFKLLMRRIDREEESAIPQTYPKAARSWWVAALLYCLITIAYFYPCVATINTSLIGRAEDNMQTYWGLSWGYDQVLHGTGSFAYVTDLYYPEGSSFYYHSWSFYNQIVSAFLRQFCNQTACYNLLILLTFPLAGIGAFLLLRYLIGNPYLALLGGFLFAFNPSHFAHAQHHLNIASIQFVPFFVLFFIKAVRQKGKANLAFAALFFLLNTLCDWNYMILAFWFMIFSYAYLVTRRGRFWLPDIALKGGVILGGTMVILSPWLIPMVVLGLKHSETMTFGHNTFVGDLAGLIVPPVTHVTGGLDLVKSINATYTGNLWEATVYLGIVAIVIFIVACRHILGRTAKYLIGTIAFLVMTLGAQPHFLGKMQPVPFPDRLVMFLPFLGNARAPSRFVVYAYLFWSIVVVLSLDWILRASKTRQRSIILSVSMVALLLFDYSFIFDKTSVVSVPACYEIMERGSERYGILDLPSGYGEVDRYMLYQSFHRLPIVQGWASRKIGNSLIDRLEFKDLNKQREQLIDAKVKYVVIHKEFLPRNSVDPKNYVLQYEKIFEDNEGMVFKVY